MKYRSVARKIAVQMLYSIDLNPDAQPASIRAAITEALELEDGPEVLAHREELERFILQLYSGVMEHRAEIDQRIVQIAQNWSLTRMAPTDRNVLRLGAFELLHTDTHYRIVIDEAVEVARLFGNKQSGQFVNGILDKLIPPSKREAAGPVPAEED